MINYNPADWYWAVAGSTTQVFSSKTGNYVPVKNPAYQAFIAGGNTATNIVSEAELGEVLAPYNLRPVAANVLNGYQDSHARKLTLEIVAKVLFNLVNEVRVLKGQAPVTAQQFRAYVKGLM